MLGLRTKHRGISFAFAFAAIFVCPPAQAAGMSMWCPSGPVVYDPSAHVQATVAASQAAYARLCSGDAAGASRAFAAIAPRMTAFKGDDSYWIDFVRGYFSSLLATGDDARARRLLTGAEEGWKAESAERLFWNGDYAGSFAAYVADDGLYLRTPDERNEHTLDPHLPPALADVRAGNIPAALTAVQTVSDKGSLYRLMLANLYAQQRDWPRAFRTWILASQDVADVPMPEWVSFDRWNIAALEMMYYYRAHAPERTAGRAR